jgi:predicted porin
VAATGAAFAQSSVTLYGIADIGYAYKTTKSGSTTTDKSNGMVSGVQSGSRWGIRGTEDLGGGMKANFNFESAIGANDGTGNNAFGRRSVVELEGGFGKVGLGRDYTPSFSLISGTDVTGTDATTTSDLYPAGVRADNMFMYTSPNFGGVVAKAGLVAQKSGAASKTAKTNSFDLSVTYAAGPLMVGAAFGNSKVNTPAAAGVEPNVWDDGDVDGVDFDSTKPVSLGSFPVAAKESQSSHNVIAATYDLGAAKLFANMINQKIKGSNVKSAETNFGVTVPMGAMTLLAGVGLDNNKSTTGVKSKATDYILGANYSISKRTNVYARYDVDQTPTVKNATKTKTTAMHLGLRHTF